MRAFPPAEQPVCKEKCFTSVITDFTVGEIKLGHTVLPAVGKNPNEVPNDTHLLLPALAVLAEGNERVKQDETDKQIRGEGGSQPEPGTRCTGARAPNIHSI